MFVIFMTIVSLILSTRAAASDVPEFGLDELQKLIDVDHQKSQASVENTILKLPEDLKKNFTLMHTSRSRMQDANPQSPRAILFGSTGSLYLTFNGDPKQKGYHALELLEFDSKTSRFTLQEVKFKDGKAEWSEKNPSRCTSCHGQNPKPIWDSYNTWRGAFGSDDDLIQKEEFNQLLKFKEERLSSFSYGSKTANPNSRYDLLRWEVQPHWPYRENYSDIQMGHRPNARMTLLTVVQQALQLVDILHSDLQLRPLALAYASIACSSDLPADFNSLLTKLKEAFGIKLSNRGMDDRSFKANLAKEILALIGQDSHLRIKSEEEKGQITHTGFVMNLNGFGLGRDHNLIRIAANELMKKFAKDASLAPFAIPELYFFDSYARSYPDFFDGAEALLKRLNEIHRPLMVSHSSFSLFCRNLLKEAERTIKSSKEVEKAKKAASLLTSHKHDLASAATGPEILWHGRCIQCHDPLPAEGRVGPYIPFRDLSKLKSYKKEMENLGLDWITSLSEVLSEKTKDSHRMPLVGEDLSPKQRDVLIRYLSE